MRFRSAYILTLLNAFALCRFSYGQSGSHLSLSLSNTRIIPLNTEANNQKWLPNREIRKHGFPLGSSIVYSPYYYYPGVILSYDRSVSKQWGASIELGYQKFGLQVGRIRFDTTSAYPKSTSPDGYYTTLPYWQDLRINQLKLGVFGIYNHQFSNPNTFVQLHLGAHLIQNYTYPNSSHSAFSISDSSKFYSHAHGINSYQVSSILVPSFKIHLGQITRHNNRISFQLSLSYLNISHIMQPFLVEYFNGSFHQTELHIPRVVTCGIGINYSYNLVNLKRLRNKNHAK